MGGQRRALPGGDADFAREIRSYRELCDEIDRVLAAGRLSEARRLNEQARALFVRLYGSESKLDQLADAERRGDGRIG